MTNLVTARDTMQGPSFNKIAKLVGTEYRKYKIIYIETWFPYGVAYIELN